MVGCGCSGNPQIREETNTKIDLPTENSDSKMIVITGKKANGEAARDRILAIQRDLVRERERERERESLQRKTCRKRHTHTYTRRNGER